MEQTIKDPDWRDREAEMNLALRVAAEFLSRWNDAVTLSQREDIRVEAALQAVQGWDRLRDKTCFAAYVRTIARRRRALAVRQRVRAERAGLAFDLEVREEFAQPAADAQWYEVAGQWVRAQDMLAVLPDVFDRLNPLNVQLIMGYYEGFSCAELAGRFNLSLDVAKVRVHRTRRQIKGLLELIATRETRESRTGAFPGPGPEPRTAAGRQQQRSATCEDG